MATRPTSPRRLSRVVLDPDTLRLWTIPQGGDEDDTDDGDGEGTEMVQISKADLQRIRDAAERDGKRDEENETLRRKIAFMEAGIDMSSEGGKLLLESAKPGEDGEFDTEALRERAEKVGALTSTASDDGGPELEDGEAGSTKERQEVAGQGGAPPEADPGERPQDRAKRAYEETLEKGGRTQQAQVDYVDVIFEAATNGDERVLVTTESPAEVA